LAFFGGTLLILVLIGAVLGGTDDGTDTGQPGNDR